MVKRRQAYAARAKSGGRLGSLTVMALLAVISLGTRAPGATADGPVPDSRVVHSSARAAHLYAQLPMSFEPNRGQTDQRVKFLARGQGYTLFLTPHEAVLTLHPNAPSGEALPAAPPAALRLKLRGANPAVDLTGEERLPGESNYFLGKDPRRWQTHLPTYAQVRYHHLYPGVDLVYYGHQGQLECDFVVAPGADPRAIRFAVETESGNSKFETRKSKFNSRDPSPESRAPKIESRVPSPEPVRIDPNGDLVVATGTGEVRFRKPVIYQPKRPVASAGNSAFSIQNSERVDGAYKLLASNQVGFEIPAHDKSRPLIIDPVLSYSTYLGGTGGDVAYGIAVDASGNAYVTGSTGSPNFPTRSAEQSAYAGNGDVCLVKFNAAGTGLVYSTYLGGSDADTATGITLDSAGDAYIVGKTYSTNFPTTTGVFQPNNAGNGDAFIAKLDPSGSVLSYASYLGGTNADFAQAIAVDSLGDAYVTGSTLSTDFPTVNPLQVGNDGGTDLFLVKVDPTAVHLLYSTYLGGSSNDTPQAIALDGSGNIYLAGCTFSTNFPTASALQSSNGGAGDAFVTEVNSTGSTLVFSTYLGGSGLDRAFGLARDVDGSIYIAGDTQSVNFPTTLNAFQTTNHGGGDVFISKLDPGGSSLVYSTLLGGSGADQATAVAVDASKNAYVTGFTQSSDFPTIDPLQKILGISGAGSCGPTLCADALVAMLGPSGGPVYSTYLGGSGADVGYGIALDSSGAVYVAGSTTSQNFPVIAGAPQGNYAATTSGGNAFVAKVVNLDAPGVALSPQQINFGNQALDRTTDPQAATLINAGSAPLSITSIAASGDFAATDNCGTVVPSGGGYCTIQITFTPTTTGAKTDQVTITDNAQGSPQVITVTGTGVTAGGKLTPSSTSLTFPAETVGVTSPAQTVLLTNTGQIAVTVTNIAISGDFAQTNTCGTLPSVLNVGQSCSVSITFTPTGSGASSGSLTVTDDAANSPQGVLLQGTGNAVFSLSSSPRSTVLTIGTASTTFTVSASAPSSFTESITLACSAGVTCSFDSASITAGQTSTLTVSGLSATTSSPLNISVTGTSGNQTTTLALTIFLADFSLSASPPLNTVTAGQSASYTVTVAPTNGFNQVVLLGCASSSLPQDTTCTWSPPAMVLNGTASATATLTITTTTQQTSRSVRRAPPPGKFRIGPLTGLKLVLIWLAVLSLLTAPVAARFARRRVGRRTQWMLRLAALGAMLGLLALAAGCDTYGYITAPTPANFPGTPTGAYTIAITGTLGNNNSVTRTTTVNLTVSPG